MLIGQILRNRYKIVKLLGRGSFGVTYLAEDTDLPNHPFCVVKNLQQSQDPEALQLSRRLFDREAEVLYRLGNECNEIPRLFAHFEENGDFYLVQEFVDGHDLGEEIFPGRRWSEAEVTQILKEILEVLVFVHDKSIIHRDIKAQNLMRRNTDGKIVLIDFGVVKEISKPKVNANEQTNATVAVGTAGYMPSEQRNQQDHPGGVSEPEQRNQQDHPGGVSEPEQGKLGVAEHGDENRTAKTRQSFRRPPRSQSVGFRRSELQMPWTPRIEFFDLQRK